MNICHDTYKEIDFIAVKTNCYVRVDSQILKIVIIVA